MSTRTALAVDDSEWVDGRSPDQLQSHLVGSFEPPLVEPGSRLHRAIIWLVKYPPIVLLQVATLAVLALTFFLFRDRFLVPGKESDLLLVGVGVATLMFLGFESRMRLNRERLQRLQVQSILARIAAAVFARPCRVTWFRRDFLHRDILVPAVRYDAEHLNPQPNSRVYYPRGVSYTGLAAKFPGRYIIYECPPFQNRGEMENHYRKAIRVPERILKLVSNRMIHARTIFSYGVSVNSPAPRLLGVLSVDLYDDADDVFGRRPFPSEQLELLVASLIDVEVT